MNQFLKLEELLNNRTFTPEMAMVLEGAVKAGLNILITGPATSGKTTLLNTLLEFIMPHQKTVIVEDDAEPQLQIPAGGRRFMVRIGHPNAKETTTEVMGWARPDWLIVGECRGAEARSVLDAIRAGQTSVMTTLRADTPANALAQFEIMAGMAIMDAPYSPGRSARHDIGSHFSLIVQMDNALPGRVRKVRAITEVLGMNGESIQLQDLFAYELLGVDWKGQAHGQFCALGVRPRFLPRLEEAGIKLPSKMFDKRTLLKD